MLTVLEPEGLYPDTGTEREILGAGARVLQGSARTSLAELPDALLAEVDGLMTLRMPLPADQLARFPRLRVVARMGVGYDRVDRAACAARGATVCNVPDYGTQEVAEFAVLLALALRRGLLLYHDTQRGPDPAPWGEMPSPLHRRQEGQTFGILGLGCIGTAAALRAKAFEYRVLVFDPHLPNGWDRAVGVERARTLEELRRRSEVLSIHAPLTRGTRGLVRERELRLLPRNAVVVNTARGPIFDLDALGRCLRDGHLAGAGLDVIPEEPPREPVPGLLRAYRAGEGWLRGRLVVTPHIAFHTPEAWDDRRGDDARRAGRGEADERDPAGGGLSPPPHPRGRPPSVRADGRRVPARRLDAVRANGARALVGAGGEGDEQRQGGYGAQRAGGHRRLRWSFGAGAIPLRPARRQVTKR